MDVYSRLTPLGKFFYKLNLVDWFIVENDRFVDYPHFTLRLWKYAIRTFLCTGHEWEDLYRAPKEGEFLLPKFCGMVKSGDQVCNKCHKFAHGR